MKFTHFFRGMIPVCMILLAVAFGLLIASCNDSAIPEVELPVPDEEQTELIPPSANPEPPELVQEYEDLWELIESKHGKTGVTDTAAILQANKIAVELAQYNGPMAQVFENMQVGVDAVFEADSTDTIDDIIDELTQKYQGISGKTATSGCEGSGSRKSCFSCCDDQKNDSDWEAAKDTAIGAATCIVLGEAGTIWSAIKRDVGGLVLA